MRCSLWTTGLSTVAGLLVRGLLGAHTASAFDASASSNLVLYWGQNSYGEVGAQEDLAYYCQDSTTDIIVLSFLYVFFGEDNLPEINFSGSCSDGSYFDGTELLQCPQIAEDIVTCQDNGKKVLLSLGGSSGSYGFDNTTQAQEFATTLWNLFGGGSSDTRPFGTAIVDGFDLDIEGGSTTGYAEFVTAMRAYYDSYTDKTMYISGAPQCPIPDEFLNDAMENSYFDFYFVQFYNNYCGADTWSANSTSSYFNFDAWDSFAKNDGYNPDAKVFLGVPGSSTAAGTGYVTIDVLIEMIDSLASTYSSFGGVSIWCLSYLLHIMWR
ncbi:glycoside hydrolase superfamily [Limtongia smithiae]|uniref:glycoside hydrolase superfamily n=1 Tax=Limtongia smithiae TaxID=1125753 RepID=UPI0034CFBB9B